MHVAVVGAGPAGATLSLLLARSGTRVTLLERESNFDRVFRGEGLMPSGVDALHQMGLGGLLDALPFRILESWASAGFSMPCRSAFSNRGTSSSTADPS